MDNPLRASALLFVLSCALAHVNAAVPDLSWLQGNWCGGDGTTQEEELWLAPRGGMMLALHRDTKGERVTGFEFLRVELRDGGATLVAQPGGRPPVRFEAQPQTSARSVSFANAEHPFPKRVRYERVDASTLQARIDDGTDTGKSFSWRWKACSGPSQVP